MPRVKQPRRRQTTGLTPAIREYNRLVAEWQRETAQPIADPATLRSQIADSRERLAGMEISYLERLYMLR